MPKAEMRQLCTTAVAAMAVTKIARGRSGIDVLAPGKRWASGPSSLIGKLKRRRAGE
jgi:hypothetical protein